MRNPKPEESKDHKHDGQLLLLCFVSSALIGYFLTHYAALLSA